jgi:TusA-related sulfurtransferase
MPRSDSNTDTVADTLDAHGLTCGRLEPMLAQRLRALAPGELLEVLSDRSEARDGIAAWVWLTGHSLVEVKNGEPPRAKYYVRKNTEKGAE